MLLGKRPRQPMRRTASLTEFSHDQPRAAEETAVAASAENGAIKRPSPQKQKQRQLPWQGQMLSSIEAVLSQPFVASSKPRNHRRHSVDFAGEAAHFLRECGLCRRRLGPGRDTFMYRGEMAFCSLECRQQQMAMDERKEKCSMASSSAGKSPFQNPSGSKIPATAGATATI